MAVLINFSLMIGGIIIDFSNVFFNYFLFGPSAGSSEGRGIYISNALANAFQLQKFLNYQEADDSLTPVQQKLENKFDDSSIGDKVFMLENTWYSVISPESCSSILFRSWEYKEIAADALKLTSVDMKKNKLIDDIIPEPLGGAHYDREATFETVKKTIVKTYNELSKKKIDTLINERMDKYANMGEFSE